MTTDRLEGKFHEGKGWVKDKMGQATGDEQMESEGKTERAEGKAKGAVAKVKDAAGDAVDAVKHAVARD